VTRLSATIIAQDEERDLRDCIASLQGFCDEILVVDGGEGPNPRGGRPDRQKDVQR